MKNRRVGGSSDITLDLLKFTGNSEIDEQLDFFNKVFSDCMASDQIIVILTTSCK